MGPQLFDTKKKGKLLQHMMFFRVEENVGGSMEIGQ